MTSSGKIVLLAGVSVLALGMDLVAPQSAQAQSYPSCDSGSGPVGGNCAGPYTFNGSGGDLVVTSFALIATGATGVSNNAAMGTLSNDGIISGTKFGVYNVPGTNPNANAASIASLVNTHTISGQMAISNSGTIGAINNSGTISGSAAAIANSGSMGPITNSGVIAGNILNYSSQDLTINGGGTSSGSPVFGTLTGYTSGTAGTITNTSSNLVFGSGNVFLNDDINVGPNTVFNNGAGLRLDNSRTITGNYSQNGGGLVIRATGGGTSAGVLNVTGNATVAKATVTISGEGLSVGQSFTVVHPSGTGTYTDDKATVIGSSGLAGTISTSGNDLVVSLVGCPTCEGFSPFGSSLGGNALSMYAVMALLLTDGSENDLVSRYGALSPDAKLIALSSLTPSPVSSPASLGVLSGELSGELIAAITQHTMLAMAGDGTAGASAGSGYRNSSVWGRVLGGTANRDSTGGIGGTAGYEMSSWGLVFGADTQVTPEVLVGGALSWSRGWTNGLDSAAGDGSNVSTYQATAYTTWARGPWIVNGMAGVGLNNYQESRNIGFLGQTAQAKFYGHQYNVEADAGYNMTLGAVTLTPTAGMRWLRLETGSYTETGSLANLTVEATTQDQVESSLGAKVDYPVDTPAGRMTPEIKAAWLHDFINGNLATTAQLGGVSFQTTSALPTADGAEVGAGVTLAATDTVSVKLEYDGQFRPDYTAHNGMLEVKTKF